jgi:hypothetical protein
MVTINTDWNIKPLNDNFVIPNSRGNRFYKPTDPEYDNNYYHTNKKNKTCDVCGKTVMER